MLSQISLSPKSGLRSPAALVALLLLTSLLGMLGSSAFPALLPEFATLWHLSNTESGWISGIFFAGYVVAVPLLVGSTDRVDPRKIYLVSLVIGGAASLAYALWAQGFWTALLFRALAGIGIAGTYMPGLKLMTDRLEGPRQPRYVAIYAAGYSLGTAFSFAFAGAVASWLGWRAAFLGCALGSLLAFALIGRLVAPTPSAAPDRQAKIDFRPVFRNRAALAFILGYAGHSWELFAYRSWLVAYLVHAGMAAGGKGGIGAASSLSALIVVAGSATSIWGAELAARADRKQVIGRVMMASFAVAVLTGFSSGLPVLVVTGLCLLYHMVIMADSGALSGGVVIAAPQEQRGVTLAVHSIGGFTAGFLGPLAVGIVLDLAGGERSRLAWGLAFLTMGAGSAAARWAIRRV